MARLCMMQRVRDGCAYFLQHFTPHACPLAKRVTTLTCSRCRRWQVRAPGGVLLLPVYGHLGGRTTGFVRHASSCLRRPRTVAAHGPRYEGCRFPSAQPAESAPSLDAGYTQPGWAIRSWQHNRWHNGRNTGWPCDHRCGCVEGLRRCRGHPIEPTSPCDSREGRDTPYRTWRRRSLTPLSERHTES